MRRSPVVERLQAEPIRRLIIQAIGPHRCLREAREAGINVIPVRDRIIEMCMPYARRVSQQIANTMPRSTRLEIIDIEQAAMVGIIIAVDSYEPAKRYDDKPIHVSTHLYFRIRKHVYEEISDAHWTIMKPPRDQVRPYMKGNMGPLDHEHYISTFVRGIDPGTLG